MTDNVESVLPEAQVWFCIYMTFFPPAAFALIRDNLEKWLALFALFFYSIFNNLHC